MTRMRRKENQPFTSRLGFAAAALFLHSPTRRQQPEKETPGKYEKQMMLSPLSRIRTEYLPSPYVGFSQGSPVSWISPENGVLLLQAVRTCPLRVWRPRTRGAPQDVGEREWARCSRGPVPFPSTLKAWQLMWWEIHGTRVIFFTLGFSYSLIKQDSACAGMRGFCFQFVLS